MLDLPKGKVQTVCGLIDSNKLGFTLPHEHLNHNGTKVLFNPRKPDPTYASLADRPFELTNKWWIDYHPYSHVDNMNYNGQTMNSIIKNEILFYKENGGNTIVENTTFGRDLNFFKQVQNQTGINIIAGAGYYIANAFSDSIQNLKIEDLYNNIVDEFTKNEIKCGVLGEIGTSYPLKDFERKVVIASGQLSEGNRNLPVTIHPGRNPKSPKEVLRLFAEAGGNVDRLVMCHLGRTIFKDEELLEFAKLGSYLQYDLFGIETSHYEVCDDIDMPSDSERVKKLELFKENGYLEKLLISQDIHTKHRLMEFGGHGFSHILMNVIPMMRRHGFTDDEIKKITVDNPARWLTY